MAHYDWPGVPAEAKEDKLAQRGSFTQRLQCHIADGFLTSVSQDFNDLLAELAQAALTEAQLDLKRWLPIGPSVILKGQATGSPRVAGRVRDIKVSPDGTRIYAASANGGVWFSADAGQSWAPLGGMATTPDQNARGRSANSLVIGCIHVEFGANADADVIYAGTGEPSTHYAARGIPGGKSGGIGILKLARTVSAALADPTGNPWEREAPNLTGAGIYRIVRDPNSANPEQLIAATTFGLFKRDGAFVKGADWARVNVAPFNVQNTDSVLTTDAAWVPAATAPAVAPARLFVALVNLGDTNRESAVYVSQAGSAGPFTKVTLAGYQNQTRLALAPVLPRIATPSTHPQVVYVLGGKAETPNLWRIDQTTARVVRDLPPPLFGGKRTGHGDTLDQSWYDMAVAADPSSPADVFIGGSTERGPDNWEAALYKGTLTGTAAADDFSFGFLAANNLTPASDPTYVGEGVHADVHIIRVSDDGRGVLVGCDGGVFASTSGGGSLSYSARNTGLAVTECGFVAAHPEHAGPVLAGTQDNGVIRRIGDSVWEMQWGGDGGGVCFHPQPGHGAFYVGQYTKVSWNGKGNFDEPIMRQAFIDAAKRHPLIPARYETESKRALFYSGPAAVPGATAGKARLAIGSHRLWLTENWEPRVASPTLWKTLPSGSDPYQAASGNFDLDETERSAGSIVSVKWQNPGTLNGGVFEGSQLLVLYEHAIARIYQDPGTTAWKREILGWSKKKRITSDSDIPANGAPTEKLPGLGAWSEIAPHRATKVGDPAFKGSFYLSATGSSRITNTGITEAFRMDTLWWFDGKDKFHPTGLRNFRDAADPKKRGTKAPAFAVICDPQDPDTVYVGTAMGVWKGIFIQAGAATPTWVWEMFSIGLPEAFVQDLAIHWNQAAPNGGLKLLRAAVQSRGVWEVDISPNPASVSKSFLRVHQLDTRQVLPTSLANLISIQAAPPPNARCLSPDIAVVPTVPASWASGIPTEADLALFTPNESEIGTPANRFIVQRLPARRHAAFVLVHHRHTRPVPAADVKVLLLKRRITAGEGDGGGIALSAAWKGAVVNLMVNGVNGNLDDHWRVCSAAEAGNPVANPIAAADIANPAGDVEARLPRAAAFQLQLTNAPDGQRYLLLALISSSRDPLNLAELGGATVADVVLGCRHVAARTVMESPLNWVTNHVLFAHLDQATNTVVNQTVPASPAELATNFYNAEAPGTIKDAGLQAALTAVLNRPAFRNFRGNIAVSLVDLSGPNKFVPRYAGHNDRKNFRAASVGKVAGLLAAYQLMADANNVLITTPAITTFAGLETALRARWTTAGIALARQPDIANVLDFQAGPRRVVLRLELLDRFNHISPGNENGATPIVLMNYPFIASTLVAHGLFSEVDKTGLWIPACYNNGRITYRGSPLRIGTWTTGDNPHRDITGIKTSAVQIAQFMTLAAQGRMIDSTTSQAVLTHLNLGGCVTSHADLTSIAGTGRISAKCGFVGDVSHDPIYFKASTGPREFVAVLLTKNNTRTIARTLFPELLNLMP